MRHVKPSRPVVINIGMYAPEFLSGICFNIVISEITQKAHPILKIRRSAFANVFAGLFVEKTIPNRNVPTIAVNKTKDIIYTVLFA